MFAHPLDYGEGPLLDQALRLARGDSIYVRPGPEPPWTVGNYPPLYPALESLGATLWGPGYWYGRLLSLLSAVAAAVVAGKIVARLTGDRRAGLVTGLLVPAVCYVGVWSALARIDTLALALSLAGLWCVVRWPERTPAVLGGAALLAAAVLTRQTYALVAPLTAVVWLSGRPRRPALLLTGTVTGLVLTVGLLLNAATRGAFWFDVVTANANALDLGLLAYVATDVLLRLPALLAAAVTLTVLVLRRRGPEDRVLLTYLLGSLVVSLTVAKVGASINYVLELSVALSMVAGTLLARLRHRPRAATAATVLLALQAASFAVPSPWHRWALDRMADEAGDVRLQQLVAEAPGPVLADEELGVLPLVGRPVELQPFELTQLAEAGRWDPGPLVAAVEEQRYALVLVLVIPDFPLERQRWPAEVLTALEKSYTVRTEVPRPTGRTLVYAPRA